MNIPPDLLKRIQATGITEEDYKRVEQYTKVTDNISPLFFQAFSIFDYHKMRIHYIAPKNYGLLNMDREEAMNKSGEYVCSHMNEDERYKMMTVAACSQDFVKNQPDSERKNIVFFRNFPAQIHGKKTAISYRSIALEIAPDGRAWLRLGVQSLSPLKNDNLLVAQNIKTHELWTLDMNSEQWIKTPLPQLSDKEKEILNLAAQGLMTKEIADILNRTESTIETHRRALFKKLNVTNMMEAVGYAMTYHLL